MKQLLSMHRRILLLAQFIQMLQIEPSRCSTEPAEQDCSKQSARPRWPNVDCNLLWWLGPKRFQFGLHGFALSFPARHTLSHLFQLLFRAPMLNALQQEFLFQLTCRVISRRRLFPQFSLLRNVCLGHILLLLLLLLWLLLRRRCLLEG